MGSWVHLHLGKPITATARSSSRLDLSHSLLGFLKGIAIWHLLEIPTSSENPAVGNAIHSMRLEAAQVLSSMTCYMIFSAASGII
jgi:hypothetical protein